MARGSWQLIPGLPPLQPHAAQAWSPVFTEFCAEIGVELEAGQYVACRVAFDGVDPIDLEPEEREIARRLFGDIDRFAPRARRVITAVCGARSGKTYVLGALRLLHLGLTVSIAKLAPGEVASGPIFAPRLDQAKQSLRFIQGAVANHPDLLKMVVGKSDAEESIELSRDGRIIEFVVRAASGQGSSGRGRSLFGSLLEETAFFRGKDHKVNDVEIFEAIPSRLMIGAQAIVSSTPWAQVGLLYDMFVSNHPNPSCAGIDERSKMQGTSIAIHAATRTMRTAPHILEIVDAEFDRDADSAKREYGAIFIAASAETFFDASTLTRCIDETMALGALPVPGDEVTSGGDLAFAKNSSALVITHRRAQEIRVADIIEHKPAAHALLKPSEIVSSFGDAIAAHQGSFFMADAHYKATAIEHLAPKRIGFVDAPTDPAEAYVATRTAMREGRVKIPKHERLLQQLREVMSKPRAGGGITMIRSRWKTGEHGDLGDAFVLAVFQAAGERVQASPPKPGTIEAEQAKVDRLRESRRRDVRTRVERAHEQQHGSRK